MASVAASFGVLCCMIALFLCTATCYKIDGRVLLPPDSGRRFTNELQILVDGGKHKGFLRTDGSFTVHNVPSGSYVVEVFSGKYVFEPIRVDISAKGNARARKVNHLRPSQVALLKYPLEMKPISYAQYFQVREKFNILEMLKSPMVLMMVLPLLMLVVLPKMMNMNDPEFKKEMEQSMNMLNTGQNSFDLSETMSNIFGGGQAKKAKAKEKKKK